MIIIILKSSRKYFCTIFRIENEFDPKLETDDPPTKI